VLCAVADLKEPAPVRAAGVQVHADPNPFERGHHHMHADVLHLLDTHLQELQALRHSLTSPRPTRPGERHDAAAATLLSTRDFAAELSQILGDRPDVPARSGPT
jgi:hypothetical protein